MKRTVTKRAHMNVFGCCIVIQFFVLKYKNVWVLLLDILFGIFLANVTQNLGQIG